MSGSRFGNGLIFWGATLSTLGATLVFVSGAASPYYVPKLFVFVLGAMLAASGRAIHFQATQEPLRISPLHYAAFGVVAAAAVGVFFSVDPIVSLIGQEKFYFHGLLAIACLASLFISCAGRLGGRDFERLQRIAVLNGSFLGVWAVVESIWAAGPTRASGPMGNAFFLAACLLPALVCAYRKLDEARGHARRLWLVSFTLIAAGIALTYTRSCAFAAILALSAAFALNRSGGIRWSPRRLALIAAALISAAALVQLTISLRDSHRQADRFRLMMWRVSAAAFAEKPLVGYGPDTFLHAYRRHRTHETIALIPSDKVWISAHNDFIQTAVTLGLMGIAAYCWIFGSLFVDLKNSYQTRRKRSAAAIAIATLLGLFFAAKFNPLPLPALAWGIVFTAAASSESVRRFRGRRAALTLALNAIGMLAAVVAAARLAAADRLLTQGIALEKTGFPARANERFIQAAALSPGGAPYDARAIAALLSKAGKESDPTKKTSLLRQAEHDAKAAARRRPGDSRTWQNLAGVLFRIGLAENSRVRLESAAAALDRALALDPFEEGLLDDRLALSRILRDPLKEKEVSAVIGKIRGVD